MNRERVAVGFDLLGAGAALLLVAQDWQSVRVERAAPLSDLATDLTGRALEPAVFGCAVVALAGAVAALATRGWARRAVGLVVALSGAAVVVRSLAAVAPIGAGRARELVADAAAQTGSVGSVGPIGNSELGGSVAGGVERARVLVRTHAQWPVLTALAGALVVLAGLTWTLARSTGRGLAARYEPPAEVAPLREISLWTALDRGDDPTAADPTGTATPDATAPCEPAEPDPDVVMTPRRPAAP